MKGTRPPTRPDEIQESFEGCIDLLIMKCQFYRAQAEEYRNDCIEGEGGLGMDPTLWIYLHVLYLLLYDRKLLMIIVTNLHLHRVSSTIRN